MKMVKLFATLFRYTRKPIRPSQRGNFIDSLRITVRGGHGGNGIPRYGGIGGQGGCVYFVAKDGITLRRVAQKLKENRLAASSGEDSSKVRIIGRRGGDTCIEVPIGVQVLDENGNVLKDLNEEDATFIAAGGGMGGCSGTNYLGKPGQHRTVSLDLKLIADVGLVGFPNAGKSTLLQAISNAKPKIASYPYDEIESGSSRKKFKTRNNVDKLKSITTIRPQIGTIEYPDLRSITIADLPGLIEGAHANFGMGHKFLKHIERTRLLLFVVDIFGFRLSPKHEQRNCLENIYALNKELEMYDPTLMDKPGILLLNKMDMDGAREIFAKVRPTSEDLEQGLEECPEDFRPTRLINFERVIPISAKDKVKIDSVKTRLRMVLDELAERKLVVDVNQVHDVLQNKVGERGPKIT